MIFFYVFFIIIKYLYSFIFTCTKKKIIYLFLHFNSITYKDYFFNKKRTLKINF